MVYRVEGRNVGDEGFGGSNVRDMDTGRVGSAGADAIVDAIKKATTPISKSMNRERVRVSDAVSSIAKRLEENTLKVQEVLSDSDDSAKQQFKELMTTLTKIVADGNKVGQKQMGALATSMAQTSKALGDDNDSLGLKAASESVTSGSGTAVGNAFRKFSNVSEGTLGVGSTLKEAFSADALLGRNKIDENADANIQGGEQAAAIQTLIDSLESLTKTVEASTAETPKKTKSNTTSGSTFTTGTDRETKDPSVKVLKEILKVLKETKADAEKNSGGLLSGLSSVLSTAFSTAMLPLKAPLSGLKNLFGLGNKTPPVTTPTTTTPTTTKPTTTTPTSTPNKKPGRLRSTLGRAARGAGRFARFLGPVGLAVTAGMAVADGVSGFNADENATMGQSFQNAGRNIMSGLSFGLIDSTQEKMADGSYEQDRILESAEDAGFYDKDYMGNSEIDKTKIQDASLPQLQAILADDDLSSQDAKFVEDLIAQKQTATPGIESNGNQSVTPGIESNGNQSSEPSYLPGPGTGELPMRVAELPTAPALGNMTEAASAPAQQTAAAPNIITTNNYNSGGDTGTTILTAPETIRNNSNTLARFNDRRFMG